MRMPVWRCAVVWLVLAPTMAAAQDTTPAPATPIGEAPEERDADEIFLRGQRVLLGRGEVVVDFGQFYSRSDQLQLALTEGTLAIATNEQTLLTTVVIGRVGVGAETEVFAATSFRRARQRLFVGNRDLATATRGEMGDVGAGIRHTFLREGVGRPDVIGTFDAQIPVDDNPYALGGGLVLVKSIDPVVLFAGANYHRSLRRDRADGTRLEPGNTADVSLGYGLALNDSLAISTAASAAFVRPPATDGTSRRIDVFSLRFALTSALARGLYIEPSVSIGLSGPGQSFALGVTVPYSF
jgi:hypothetical protein